VYKYTDPDVLDELIGGVLDQQMKYNTQKPGSLKTLLVLDDVISYINFKSKLWDRIASSSRHFNLSVILLLQNLSSSIAPIMRDNSTVMFITKIKALDIKKAFSMQSHFAKEDDFAKYLTDSTRDFGVVRVELTGKEPGIMDWHPPVPSQKKFRIM
jgi:hypothetical protein